MKAKFFKKALVVATAGAISASSYAYFHHTNDVRGQVQSQTNSLTQYVTNRNNQLQQTVDKAITKESEAILEAIRILTKQTALSHQELARSDFDSKKTGLAIERGMVQSEAVVESVKNYGAKTGQGYNICHVMAESNKLVQAKEDAKQEAGLLASTTDNVGGRMVANATDAQRERARVHRENFCTQSEVDSKMCDAVSEYAGADSNAATLNLSSKAGDKLDMAKTAFRQNVLGAPDKMIPANVGNTAAGQAYLAQTNQRQARLSPASYSMGYLHAMSTKREDLLDSKGEPMSPDEKIEATVNRYYGTEESKEWLKTLIAQRPRGLLVEQVKMNGVEAFLNYDLIQSDERQIAMYASLLATATEKMDVDMQKQFTHMRSN